MTLISAIEICGYGNKPADQTTEVSIEGISRRGLVINGGFYALPAEVMDNLAAQWLRARGWMVGRMDE